MFVVVEQPPPRRERLLSHSFYLTYLNQALLFELERGNLHYA